MYWFPIFIGKINVLWDSQISAWMQYWVRCYFKCQAWKICITFAIRWIDFCYLWNKRKLHNWCMFSVQWNIRNQKGRITIYMAVKWLNSILNTCFYNMMHPYFDWFSSALEMHVALYSLDRGSLKLLKRAMYLEFLQRKTLTVQETHFFTLICLPFRYHAMFFSIQLN